MCFFYALSQEAQALENRLLARLDFSFEPIYYVAGFDYPQMPVVTANQPDLIQTMHWGLIPFWTKEENAEKMRSYTLNARSDSLFSKPSFKDSINRRRCLIPATGFYEWRDWRGKKYPYLISHRDGEVFNFAGIWDEWQSPARKEIIRTYSIITTDANKLLKKIHNIKKRMPVILGPTDEKKWLSPNLSEDEILALTKPREDLPLDAFSIGRLITTKNQNRNTPEIQKRYRYAGLPEL